MGLFKKRDTRIEIPIECEGWVQRPNMLEHFTEEWFILFALRSIGVDSFPNNDYEWRVTEPPRPDSENIANANVLSPNGITWRVTYAYFDSGNSRCTFAPHMVNPDPDLVQAEARAIRAGLDSHDGLL